MFTRDRLNETLSRMGASPAPRVFRELQKMYREADRFYHTEQHVVECLRALDRHVLVAGNPAEIELAIWFHDAVYDPRKSDNEARSAALARRTLLSVGVGAESVGRIASMILATRTHRAQGSDAELMLDIDLEILGQPQAIFWQYDQAIRKEYAWVPEAQYLSARARVLQGFLERSSIYCTAAFREAREQQARLNIERRLRALAAAMR